jgi:uncharacterized membrane protein
MIIGLTERYCPSLPRTDPICPCSSKTDENCRKLSKTVQNCPKLSKKRKRQMSLLIWTCLIVCWGSTPFLKKRIGQNISSHDFAIMNHAAVTVIFLALLMLLYVTQETSLRRTLRHCASAGNIGALILLAVLTVLSSVCLLHLLQKHEASIVMATVQPLSLSLTFLLGLVFAAKKPSFVGFLGFALVCIGVVCLHI